MDAASVSPTKSRKDFSALSFAPLGLVFACAFHPRLAPWAVFFRRFAACANQIRAEHTLALLSPRGQYSGARLLLFCRLQTLFQGLHFGVQFLRKTVAELGEVVFD